MTHYNIVTFLTIGDVIQYVNFIETKFIPQSVTQVSKSIIKLQDKCHVFLSFYHLP